MLSCYLHVGGFGWLPPLVIVFLKLSVLFTAWKSSLVLYAALLALGVGEFSQEIYSEGTSICNGGRILYRHNYSSIVNVYKTFAGKAGFPRQKKPHA